MSNTWAEFGTLPDESGENGVQATILRAFTYIFQSDQRAFRKKFKEQKDDEQQAMHTFRELLVGVFMTQQLLKVQYELKIKGLTPDWGFQHDGCGAGIADVVNVHVERGVEQQIERALEHGQTWSGEIPDQSRRLRGSLRGKAEKYHNLVVQKSVPYVVFIFGWMNAVVESCRVEEGLLDAHGLFYDLPTLSGVYYMYERGDCRFDNTAGYRFCYFPNPNAIYAVGSLKNGALPYNFPTCSEP